MWLTFVLGGMVPFSLLLALIYFIFLPVVVLRLIGRVKTLERKAEKDTTPVAPMKRKGTAEPEPEAQIAPAYAEVAKPIAEVRAKPSSVGTQSLEEKVGGHWFQWIGIAALVAALIFFLNASFDSGLVGPTGRTFVGYAISVCAIIAGDRLRKRYGAWSLAFTGGGALCSYIVTWIALHT